MTTQQMDRHVPWAAGISVAGSLKSDRLVTAPTVRQAMVEAGLNWEVTKEPAFQLHMNEDGVGYREIPKQVVLTRSTDGQALQIVGEGYQPLQNFEHAEITDAMVDMGGVETAGVGETDDGKRVYTVIKFTDTPERQSKKDLGCYLILTNGHGGLSLTCSTFILEYACTNGMVGIAPNSAYSWKIKHTANLKVRIRQMQQVMGNTVEYIEQVHNLHEQLMNTPLAADDVSSLLTELLPITPKTKPAARTAQLSRRAGIMATWVQSNTMNAETRYSGWGLVHAVSEWDQFSIRANSRRRTDDMTRLTNDRWSNLTNRTRDLILAT